MSFFLIDIQGDLEPQNLKKAFSTSVGNRWPQHRSKTSLMALDHLQHPHPTAPWSPAAAPDVLIRTEIPKGSPEGSPEGCLS